jgi:hypothetical protein
MEYRSSPFLAACSAKEVTGMIETPNGERRPIEKSKEAGLRPKAKCNSRRRRNGRRADAAHRELFRFWHDSDERITARYVRSWG